MKSTFEWNICSFCVDFTQTPHAYFCSLCTNDQMRCELSVSNWISHMCGFCIVRFYFFCCIFHENCHERIVNVMYVPSLNRYQHIIVVHMRCEKLLQRSKTKKKRREYGKKKSIHTTHHMYTSVNGVNVLS